ncbi:MAG: carboxypeptidase regulatory-like domain-containing protein [Verrucomicrobia bacterium]|nr:carboxypeptidase regulatory-like domain-containing protein [Verrucomicrobiota bacterium]
MRPHRANSFLHRLGMCLIWVTAGVLLNGSTNILLAQAPTNAARSFDIPATTADKALPQFSDQSGREVLFGQSTATKVRTNAVKGVYTPREALNVLLEGTGLVAPADEKTGAFSISRSSDPNARRAALTTASDRPNQSAPTASPTTNADSLQYGTIAGQVYNPATGANLEKARITVDGTTLETFTDSGGKYRLTNVPAGTVKVKAFYTGLAPQTNQVTVVPDQTVQHNIALAGFQHKGDPDGAITRLEKYVVSSSKEMDGAAIAINEQRFAPNVVSVVAADEFGSMAEGNVAEFMKFLPGVTMNVGESGDANTVSINGVPAANVPITVGGFDLASANQFFGTGTGREVNLDQVSLNSIARIEVAYTPTPEVTGSALAGSVNMVPRSAFERSRPEFYRNQLRCPTQRDSPWSEVTSGNAHCIGQARPRRRPKERQAR